MDQKLWMFDFFKEKSVQGKHVLEPTSKSWPHVQKIEGRKKKSFLQGVSLGHPAAASKQSLVTGQLWSYQFDNQTVF